MRRYKRDYRRTFKSKADFARDTSNAKPNWKWIKHNKKKKKLQTVTPHSKRHIGGHNTGYLYDLLKHLITEEEEGE